MFHHGFISCRRIGPVCCLAALFFLPAVTEVAGSSASDGPAFFTSHARVWLGRSQVIPIQLGSPAEETKSLVVTAEPDGMLEILQQPTVLRGEKIGYVRVKPIQEGRVNLRLSENLLNVEVRSDPSLSSSLDRIPRIISPASGAAVWSKFLVGVEHESRSSGENAEEVCLIGPDGKKITARPQIRLSGPHRHLLFDLDVSAWPQGRAEIRALATYKDGKEEQSAPLFVQIIRPEELAMFAGECEDHIQTPRPRRNGEEFPKVARDETASGGACINNHSADPAWCVPVRVETPAFYQMMIRARGEFGGGAFPTVGLRIDEADQPATMARILDENWHRLPLGKPVRLAAGDHTLTVHFRNDFYEPKLADRNLFLDSFEVVRLESQPDPSGMPEGDGTSMMSEAGTMMEPSIAPMMMDAKSADPAMMMMQGKTSIGGPEQELRIAFREIFDGRTIAGPIVLRGLAWWEPESTPPPGIGLIINDRLVETQQSDEVSFRIYPAQFLPGINRVKLRAQLGSGRVVESVEQTLVLNQQLRNHEFPSRRRFSVHSDSWDPGMPQRIEQRKSGRLGSSACFYSNGEAFLELPGELEGTWQISLEARGDEFQGYPVVGVTLKSGNQEEIALGQTEVRSRWSEVRVGNVTMEKGPKKLVVRFLNDLYEKGKGDRNLWIRSLVMETPSHSRDQHAPRLNLIYPRNVQTPGAVDMVIAELFDEQEIEWADLFIDGKSQSLRTKPRDGSGPLIFPLFTRSLSPGVHALKVVARDRAGNYGESKSIRFQVLDPSDDSIKRERTAYERAVHLLNRFGFGPEQAEIGEILRLGESEWLRERLNESLDSSREKALSEKLHVEFPNSRNGNQIKQRVLQHLVGTANPIRARFVMWTQNHFSTWIGKIGADRKWDEHLRFSHAGTAPFAELLRISATSPAMLIYLDQQRSFARRLNENYAREIMELHTLGVKGGYSQEDVTTLARLLNGWTATEEAPLDGRGGEMVYNFRFDPILNDGKTRRLIGVEYPDAPPEARFDRIVQTLEILAAHPSTARFVAGKLAAHYVMTSPSEGLVADLAEVFMRSGGDMREILLAIAAHPDFWSSAEKLKMATPLDYGVKTARMAAADRKIGTLNQFLQMSGMGLFDRATPDGYPEEDQAYADSNALLQRWKLARNLAPDLARLIPHALLHPVRSKAAEGDALIGAVLSTADVQKLIDFTAWRLTGDVLTAQSNESAVKICLRQLSGKPGEFNPEILTAFIGQLPEANLR